MFQPWVRRVLVVLAALGLMLTGVGSSALAQAEDPSWVDQPLAELPAWNSPGMMIPRAPTVEVINPRCGALGRWVESELDQAVVDAGWNLFGDYRGGWGIQLIDATAGYDGMCRPMEYQAFVFVDGTFAGTISPEPMKSRSTGTGSVIGLANGSMTARFQRYASTDPLCCPSRGAVVIQYKIDQTPEGPVLTPVSRFEEPAPTAAGS